MHILYILYLQKEVHFCSFSEFISRPAFQQNVLWWDIDSVCVPVKVCREWSLYCCLPWST